VFWALQEKVEKSRAEAEACERKLASLSEQRSPEEKAQLQRLYEEVSALKRRILEEEIVDLDTYIRKGVEVDRSSCEL
jgi:hypothetical protein